MTSFHVLFVCTGNVCRSPLAERLLRRRLDDLLGDAGRETVTVSSSGVRALAGHAMDPSSARELDRLGGSDDGFRARQFIAPHAQEAGLLLTATKAHRSRVLEEEPSALRRTFTLREFAALVDGVEAESPEGLVAHAARQRGSAVVPDYDLQDPIGASEAVHRAVADDIDQAVGVVASALTLAVAEA